MAHPLPNSKDELIRALEQLDIGLERFTVRHTPYSERWPAAFELVASVIKPFVGDARIHHIGSTAIPGCNAKPILDIGIEHSSTSGFRSEVSSLVALGFTSKGEHGVSGREFFSFYNAGKTHDYIHLHAFEVEHPKMTAYLTFRDAHITEPDLVREYNALKERLVRSGISRKDYPEAKTGYVEGVLGLATVRGTAPC